jgi:hypothetical protein
MASVIKVSEILHPTANVPSLTINSDSTVSFDAGILNVTGPINGVIGANTPYSGTFTSLSDSGNLNFTGTGNRITGDFSNATIASRLMFQNSVTNGSTVVNALPNGTSVASGFAAFGNSDPANTSIARLVNIGSEASVQSNISGTGTYVPMTFYTGGSEAMRITTSRNVGIGTAGNATVRLDVSAVTNNYAASFYSNTGSGVTAGLNSYGLAIGGNVSNGSAEVNLIYGSAGGGLAFNSFNGTTIAERMRLDASGNLGIGVTPSAWSTDYRGHIQGIGWALVTPANGGFNTFSLTSNAYNSSGATWNYRGTADASMYQQFNGAHLWYNAPSGTAGNAISFTQAMTLDASGNLLVGTTDTGFNARQLVRFSASGTSTRGLVCWNGGGAGAEFIGFSNSGGAIIGSISQSGEGAIAYITSSDYRLKENVAPMTGALEKVAALKPCTYTWKSDGSVGQGFIAHELQSVVPDCVTGEKDAVDEEGNPEYQGVDTSFLVATLTAAIQELKSIIDQQDARIKTLEGNV